MGGVTVIFDTDVLIWLERGSEKALKAVEEQEERCLSLQSYMELLQGARSKGDQQIIRNYLSEYGFTVLPITQTVGHRAAIYIEEYALTSGLRTGDALIAATAHENHMTLMTSNIKHFRAIKDLDLKVFKP